MNQVLDRVYSLFTDISVRTLATLEVLRVVTPALIARLEGFAPYLKSATQVQLLLAQLHALSLQPLAVYIRLNVYHHYRECIAQKQFDGVRFRHLNATARRHTELVVTQFTDLLYEQCCVKYAAEQERVIAVLQRHVLTLEMESFPGALDQLHLLVAELKRHIPQDGTPALPGLDTTGRTIIDLAAFERRQMLRIAVPLLERKRECLEWTQGSLVSKVKVYGTRLWQQLRSLYTENSLSPPAKPVVSRQWEEHKEWPLGNECAICLSDECVRPHELLGCGHWFGLSCIREWVRVSLEEQQQVPVCPLCNTALPATLVEAYDYGYPLRWIVFQAWLQQQSTATVHACETHNCPGIHCALNGRQSIDTCVFCLKHYCFGCHVYHEGSGTQRCKQFQQWKLDNERVEESFQALLFNGTLKRCPQCREVTSKDGGCDHMTCKKCRHQYWWSTLTPYPDGAH